MVKDARLGKEIDVTVVNKIGVLADMSKILAEHGINIEAVAGYAQADKNAKVMLVAEDTTRAVDALKGGGYKNLQENEVVIVELENKAGALKHITAKLAAVNIDIKQVYGSACAAGCPAKIIISTTDNEKAAVALKK